jgi:hypothetical protein
MIPDFVLPKLRATISACWRIRPQKRRSFAAILAWLQEMKFKILRRVRSKKVQEFVGAIKKREFELNSEIDDG